MTKKLTVVYRPRDDLVPNPNNSRTHSDKQVAQIAASIREFGFTNPILIDDDHMIIAGHGRLAAAEKLGMDKVPTLLLEGLTEAQRRALLIADNKLAENAAWDMDMLKLELTELNVLGFDLGVVGFSIQELANILGTDEGGKDDDKGSEGGYVEQYGVIVMCKDEAHQENVFNELTDKGYDVKVVNT